MTHNAPQVILKICFESFAKDEDLDHLVQGISWKELYEILGLGWTANGTPIQEEIIAIDWERVT